MLLARLGRPQPSRLTAGAMFKSDCRFNGRAPLINSPLSSAGLGVSLNRALQILLHQRQHPRHRRRRHARPRLIPVIRAQRAVQIAQHRVVSPIIVGLACHTPANHTPPARAGRPDWQSQYNQSPAGGLATTANPAPLVARHQRLRRIVGVKINLQIGRKRHRRKGVGQHLDDQVGRPPRIVTA